MNFLTWLPDILLVNTATGRIKNTFSCVLYQQDPYSEYPQFLLRLHHHRTDPQKSHLLWTSLESPISLLQERVVHQLFHQSLWLAPLAIPFHLLKWSRHNKDYVTYKFPHKYLIHYRLQLIFHQLLFSLITWKEFHIAHICTSRSIVLVQFFPYVFKRIYLFSLTKPEHKSVNHAPWTWVELLDKHEPLSLANYRCMSFIQKFLCFKNTYMHINLQITTSRYFKFVGKEINR